MMIGDPSTPHLRCSAQDDEGRNEFYIKITDLLTRSPESEGEEAFFDKVGKVLE